VSRPTKPATVRFYFDADVLGLAKTVVTLRSDVTYPGDPGGVVHSRERPACPITSPATPDSTWIAEVGGRGWLTITRDRHIRDHRREIEAVRDHDAITFHELRHTFGTRMAAAGTPLRTLQH
jgi:hypothetical protein